MQAVTEDMFGEETLVEESRVDLSRVDIRELVAEILRRPVVPIGLLRNGDGFVMGPLAGDETVGVKISGSLGDCDVKVAIFRQHGAACRVADRWSSETPVRRSVGADTEIAADGTIAPPKISATKPAANGSPAPKVSGGVKVIDLLRTGLLLKTDELVLIAGTKSQKATVNDDGQIVVAGVPHDSISAAGMRASELIGKARISINGWAAFDVLRAGKSIGTMSDVRARYTK